MQVVVQGERRRQDGGVDVGPAGLREALSAPRACSRPTLRDVGFLHYNPRAPRASASSSSCSRPRNRPRRCERCCESRSRLSRVQGDSRERIHPPLAHGVHGDASVSRLLPAALLDLASDLALLLLLLRKAGGHCRADRRAGKVRLREELSVRPDQSGGVRSSSRGSDGRDVDKVHQRRRGERTPSPSFLESLDPGEGAVGVRGRLPRRALAWSAEQASPWTHQTGVSLLLLAFPSILTSPLLRSLSFTRYASDDDEEETAAALAAYCCNYRPPAALAARFGLLPRRPRGPEAGLPGGKSPPPRCSSRF